MTDTRDIELIFELPHAPAKVWRALTEPELLARWLMKTDLRPEVGHAFQFRREPLPHWDGVVDCEILEVEAPKTIRYTWRALGVDTVVTWTLQPTATGTRLALRQTGFSATNRQAIGGARAGWNHMVGDALVRVLDELT